jgi:hypothetical protein
VKSWNHVYETLILKGEQKYILFHMKSDLSFLQHFSFICYVLRQATIYLGSATHATTTR